MNSEEMMLGSAAAAGVSVAAIGGAVPAPGRPQLNRPPEPVTLTPPFAHAAPFGPLFAQSNVLAPVLRIEPSMASQPDGAAATVTAAAPSRNAAATADATRGHGRCSDVMLFTNRARAAYLRGP